ncbi:Uncharacterized protein, UPF0371 family [Desulfocicer vacuolatum DSM 3385]|uniref:Uncharacterized protein, UPF0371 family n=1 Tax=Desulfocicer vacuolatum DSM 3385 TaxID=1121400 RepID=A0A1W2ELM7_9BACT|nr:DUF1846 domain-containing protein [Desulfocicer vacuolatum]SMD10564.1 Uncharacterized protein, UPF0371 family [Desulfocicer vacuolatum DSM 3385]
MSKKTIFDNDQYLKEQAGKIRQRIKDFDNKLYLEFGGKLLFDYHAARVLPGYDPNIKIRLLQELKDQAEVLICIYAGDIERKKIRADFGITYETDILKIIDDLKSWGVFVRGVIITRFENQPSAVIFKKKLERRNINVYTHYFTKGYPTDVELIVSDEGYGANDYIKTERPLVIVTGPGPGSGKMATCLSQLFHDHRHGIQSGYAKFETFPVWNLPLKHPVNVAYEAATADLADLNMIDPFHLEAYQVQSVNYNRDVDVFPVLQRILKKITGDQSCYRSPTDMGVNRVGFAITDDEGAKKAALQELIRRFLRYQCEYALGLTTRETVQRAELLMKEFNLCPEDRPVVSPAQETAQKAINDPRLGSEGIYVGAAIELADGTIITGTNSPRMHAASSVIVRALKHLAGIPNKIQLMPEKICDSVSNMKTEILNEKSLSMDLQETLIALAISATSNHAVELAMEMLAEFKDCEMHMTHMPSPGDEEGIRRLGINLTTDPLFATNDLYTM